MAKGLKGKLITLEGAEGSGKSTQAALLCGYLKKKGLPVFFLREPGGVKISERIRKLLLDVKNATMSPEAEMLLYMAARAQLVHELLVPLLKEGKIVVCDRFLDSTVVYQGYGHGMDIGLIAQVGNFATQGVTPDLTLLFDLSPEKGLSRIQRAKDRIELRPLAYHQKVRRGYLALAKANPKRIKVIVVDRGKEEIFEEVRSYVDPLISRKT